MGGEAEPSGSGGRSQAGAWEGDQQPPADAGTTNGAGIANGVHRGKMGSGPATGGSETVQENGSTEGEQMGHGSAMAGR